MIDGCKHNPESTIGNVCRHQLHPTILPGLDGKMQGRSLPPTAKDQRCQMIIAYPLGRNVPGAH